VRRPSPPASLVVAAAAGGMLGALLRWELGVLVPDDGGFPWTTFAINVSGSFLLAALPALAAVRRHPVLPVFLGTGVLGGYTTLSTYAEQCRSLLADGRTVLATAYLAGTLLACLAAVLAAHRLSSPDAQHEFEAEEGNE
jgi:fluoride exporter